MSSTPPPPPPTQPPPPDGPAASPADTAGKPWWRRWWVLGLAGIVVIGALASLGESEDDLGDEAGGEATATEAVADRATPSQTAATSPTATASSTPDAEPTTEPEPEPVAVPEVTGLAEAEAIDALDAAGLQARVEEQDVTNADDQGMVLEQRPPAGAELAPDATVRLTVGGEFVWADPITLTGTGDDVLDVEVPDDAIAIARIRHDGGGNFAVWSYDEAGNQIDLLVNDIGSYEGVRLVNLQAAARELEVTAGGGWTIELAPLQDARRFAADGTIDGTGDDVVVADESTVDGSRLALSYSGDGNFAIWAYAETTTDLLVNDVGPYEGRTRWPGGIVFLDITAGGPWSLTIE